MSSFESQSPDPFKEAFARRIVPSPELPSKVAHRLRRRADDPVDPLEETLEGLLAAWPVEPSASFAADIRSKIAAEAHPKAILEGPWRAAIAMVAAVAAAISLTFLPPPEMGSQEAPGALVALPFGPPDPEAAQILALAMTLDEKASWLLRGNHFETIATAYR